LRGPGAKAARSVIAYGSGLAANPFESALRVITIEAGLTHFVPQFVIHDGNLSWRVDLADELCRLIAEADSFAHHGSRTALARDCRRYDELTSRDWIVLRYAWDHVMFEPDWVRRTLLDTHQLRKAYRRGGAKGLS
jgi:very-short-patch-repair endonuclease